MGALDGKTAIVTGGTRRIGKAIVSRLVAEGATVVFTYTRGEDAATALEEATDKRAIAVRADQGRVDEVERVFDFAEERLGPLDILVLNAAINPVKAIEDIDEDDYDRVMDVNARGPFFAIRHAGRRLRDGGRIIGLSTLNTAIPSPGIALYAASKAALEQFVAVAAREFGPRGITANVTRRDGHRHAAGQQSARGDRAAHRVHRAGSAGTAGQHRRGRRVPRRARLGLDHRPEHPRDGRAGAVAAPGRRASAGGHGDGRPGDGRPTVARRVGCGRDRRPARLRRRGRAVRCGSPVPVSRSRSPGRHVNEAAVVSLERDGHGGGGAVTVLGHDQVGLSRAR